jgi:hemerythrin superfamily protein
MADPIEMLMQDHRKVEELFGRYEQSQDPAVIEQICTELTIHASIEEQVIYPALGSEVDGGEDMRDHAEQEHQEVKDAISEIERLGYSAAEVSEPMRRIISGVSEHVQEEESEVFPKMREDIDAERLSALGDELATAKQEATAAGRTP